MAHIVPQLQTRSTRWASNRLRVEAPILNIVIFTLTIGAQLKSLHRRVRPIIGQALDYAETRPAARAIQKRIAIPPIVRIRQLATAFGARCQVRHDPRDTVAGHVAVPNPEPSEPRGVKVNGFDSLNQSQGRSVSFELCKEGID